MNFENTNKIIIMNVSYKWLKEYVDFDLTPQEVADALTSCGLEVDALEEVQSIKGDCTSSKASTSRPQEVSASAVSWGVRSKSTYSLSHL